MIDRVDRMYRGESFGANIPSIGFEISKVKNNLHMIVMYLQAIEEFK